MAHKLIRSFFQGIYRLGCPSPLLEEEGIRVLTDLLGSDTPCMISRFGSVELQTLCYEKLQPWLLPLKRRTWRNLGNSAGFFPVDGEHIRRFYELYKADTAELDVLITWRFEEMFFRSWIGDIPRVSKRTLDGFYDQDSPWTRVLTGKRILVVHPFAETIREQYERNRANLFANPLTLPVFGKLETIKAVQSIAGNPVDFPSWFEALAHMKALIDEKEFDIALLGCGAYGMPLAAHIKRMGRKAVHLGGVTQFLFGVKGKRYVDNPQTNRFINEYFVSPRPEDRPERAGTVEGGCYW
ncbi:hypothetical protein [Alistipes provencensis]|uniref:hypothetical protein n=1 Tax=Alistipes provencensis TaxID=1816676 RepID=UPI0007EC774E|nr:hypothetical protein [Alistipes provencensis]